MKKVIPLLIAVLTFGVIPAAQAESPIFVANSLEDRTQPSGMGFRYALTSTSIEILDTNPGVLIVKVNFAGDVNNSSFMPYGSSTPMLRVKILTSGGHRDDTGFIWMDAPRDVPYQGSTPIYAPSSYYSDGKSGVPMGRQSLAPCKPTTWLDASGSSNWIKFAIDMNCADIPVTFSVTTLIDADIYSPAAYLDNKYAPAIPMYIDTKGVKRPPKMKNQTVTFVGSIPTQNLDNPKVTSALTSSLNLSVTVNSLTPTICSPSLSGLTITTSLLKAGTCTLEAFAAGDSATNPSPRVTQSFTVNPKVMLKQELSWNRPEGVKMGDDPFDLRLLSDSGLPVIVTSSSPSVCQFNDPTRPSWVTIVGSGTCYTNARVLATDKYFETSGSASFVVAPAPKPTPTRASPTPTRASPTPTRARTTPSPTPSAPDILISSTVKPQPKVTTRGKKEDFGRVPVKVVKITCQKGKIIKTIEEPKCPAGYTKVK